MEYTEKDEIRDRKNLENRFFRQVKKLFPNATRKSIRLNKYQYLNFCWCYGGINKKNMPDKYHKLIEKINEIALKMAEY